MFSKSSLIIAFLFISLSHSYAQQRKDSIHQLGEVVIHHRPFQDLIPVQELSGEQLERLNAHTVADALRYFAGVQIKDYGGVGGLKTIDVRNMGTHHVGVFFDGIQLGNAQNGIVDLGKYSLDDMEMLTLYNGQRSDIFQSAKEFASASTVYMSSKVPVFKSDQKTHLRFRYKSGSIQTNNPSFRLEQKISDQVAVSLSGEWLKSDGKYPFQYRRLNIDGSVAYDTTAIRQNSDIESYRIEGGIYGKTAKGHWKGKLYYYDSDRGMPGAIVKNVWKNGERGTDKNVLAQAELTQLVSDRYKFQLKGKFAYDYTRFIARDSIEFFDGFVTNKMQVDNSYYQQDFYVSAVNHYRISPIWDVSLATDLQYNKLNGTREGNGTLFTFPQRFSLLTALATSLDLGAFKAQASLLGTFTKEKVRHNAQAPDKRVLTPAVFLSYKPWANEDLVIHSFYKHIFRMPTFNDLYYTQIGNANLKPEYSRQLNLGMHYTKALPQGLIESLNFKVEGYYMNITDKIIATPTGSMFRWMMTNIGKTEGYGLEATAGLVSQIDQVTLTANANYSFMQAKNFTKIRNIPLSSYGDQIPYAPWHSGSAIVGLDYSQWSFNYSFIYVGKRYDAGVNNIARNEVQPWYTHDLSIHKQLNFQQYAFRIALEANNLANQYHEVVTNYPMPGRNFRLILTLEL